MVGEKDIVRLTGVDLTGTAAVAVAFAAYLALDLSLLGACCTSACCELPLAVATAGVAALRAAPSCLYKHLSPA